MQCSELTHKAHKRSAISPVIATLLLIIIAVATGVLIYAYTIGFISNSTQNPGTSQSVISIDNACISLTSSHCSQNGYSVTIRNLGTTNILSGTVEIYFVDAATSSNAVATCTLSSSLAPGATLTCPTTTGVLEPLSSANQGDSIQIKVVMPDGGSAVATTRLLA